MSCETEVSCKRLSAVQGEGLHGLVEADRKRSTTIQSLTLMRSAIATVQSFVFGSKQLSHAVRPLRRMTTRASITDKNVAVVGASRGIGLEVGQIRPGISLPLPERARCSQVSTWFFISDLR